MSRESKIYNPRFLDDDQLVASFCVRTSEFDSIVEALTESTGNSNRHLIVIGPRGSGKTYLLLRVAAEMRRNGLLAGLFPVVFAEESYEVSTCGEFWLECLNRLADQAPQSEADDLRRAHEEFRTGQDDRVLTERCLGVLLDFADRHRQRLVVVVENLNMLFADATDSGIGWKLRKTLQTEPRIMLVGSATSRFKEIDRPDHALYDLFRVITLRPLGAGECETLWERVSGYPSSKQEIRPLQILTGGSARLLTIIANFGAGHSFPELMDSLLNLVDEYTEYFKGHLERLPVQERRVYLALAQLWKSATTKEIAAVARISTNICSAQLGRLVDRGVVEIDGGTGRRKKYYLTERLYNVYYLLRRGGEAGSMVAALVRFMASYYAPSELARIVERIAADAKTEEPQMRELAQSALVRLLEPSVLATHRDELLTNKHVVDLISTGDVPTERSTEVALALVRKGLQLHQNGRLDEALDAYEDTVRRFSPGRSRLIGSLMNLAQYNKGVVLLQTKRFAEAIACYDEILGRSGGSELVPKMLVHKGIALTMLDRKQEALRMFEEALRRCKSDELLDTTLTAARALIFEGLLLADAEAQEAGEISERLCALDVPDVVRCVAGVLVNAGIAMPQEDWTIQQQEAEALLGHLVMLDKNPRDSIKVLIHFVACIGPVRALEFIEASPESAMLLPLVTALKRSLGHEAGVAREIEEVAVDIQCHLEELLVPAAAGTSRGDLTHLLTKAPKTTASRVAEVSLPMRTAVLESDGLEVEYRMEEEEIRRKHEAEVRSNPILDLEGEMGTVAVEWGIFEDHVSNDRFNEAWALGSQLVGDLRCFGTLSEPMKPYFLNYMFLAAYYTGRPVEALEYINQASETCQPEQDPLYKTILSNQALGLSRLGRFKEAYDTLESALAADPTFMMVLYNGLFVACIAQDEVLVGRWRERVTACAERWTPMEIEQFLEGLETDHDMRWGREQGLLQPLVEHLRAIRGDVS